MSADQILHQDPRFLFVTFGPCLYISISFTIFDGAPPQHPFIPGASLGRTKWTLCYKSRLLQESSVDLWVVSSSQDLTVPLREVHGGLNPVDILRSSCLVPGHTGCRSFSVPLLRCQIPQLTPQNYCNWKWNGFRRRFPCTMMSRSWQIKRKNAMETTSETDVWRKELIDWLKLKSSHTWQFLLLWIS